MTSIVSSGAPPLRIFLDAGIVIDGCSNTWGAAKALLILSTRTAFCTIVLADVVDREIRRALLRKTTGDTLAGVHDVLAAY